MKSTFVLLAIFFLTSFQLRGQGSELLTNATIVKMVQANLSEEIIIDEIQNSKVNFFLNDEEEKALKAAKVSEKIIQVMKASIPEKSIDRTLEVFSNEPKTNLNLSLSISQVDSSLSQNQKLVETNIVPGTPESSNEISHAINNELPAFVSPSPDHIEFTELNVRAMSYVIPLLDLLTLMDKEYSLLYKTINMWDQQLFKVQQKISELADSMQIGEKELSRLKNADSKSFSAEVISTKKQLIDLRIMHAQLIKDMQGAKQYILLELTKSSSDYNNALLSKYSELSKRIKKAKPKLTDVANSKNIIISSRNFSINVEKVVSPLLEMLFFYQNEIIDVSELIKKWNTTVELCRKKDSELRKNLESIRQEIEAKKENSKANKNTISQLKKQESKLEKELKLLSKQIIDDSKKLSKFLNQRKLEVSTSQKERFQDIIENVTYLAQVQF